MLSVCAEIVHKMADLIQPSLTAVELDTLSTLHPILLP
jgi:hypothetical protein